MFGRRLKILLDIQITVHQIKDLLTGKTLDEIKALKDSAQKLKVSDAALGAAIEKETKQEK